MALFLSSYVNKVDRKGRVSVPAPFRAALAAQPFAGVVLFRAHAQSCLEGFGGSAMEDLGRRLDNFDVFSADHDDLAMAVFGAAVPLPFDGEGRIVLPADLVSFAGLAEDAAFVGMGPKFQIWNPAALAKRMTSARAAVKDRGLTLPKAAGEGGAA